MNMIHVIIQNDRHHLIFVHSTQKLKDLLKNLNI